MRVLFTIICLFLIGIVSNGQSDTDRRFKTSKLDFSQGFVLPLQGGSGEKAGWLIALEQKYALSDKFTLGLRWETAIISRTIGNSEGKEDVDGHGNFSFTITCDYYFNTNKLRPFIGGGLGYNWMARPIKSDILILNDFAFKFGYMLRAGFEIGHFRLGLEYNRIGSTNSYPDNNYIGFKVGVFFGGGRIKK